MLYGVDVIMGQFGQVVKLVIMTVAIADYGNCLRCLCQSTINGVPTTDPLPECDGNATCTIPQLPNGDPSGLCYKKVVGSGGAVVLTYSCADLNLHRVNPKLCAGTEISRERYKEIVCCSEPDYCNAELSLQAKSSSPEPSPNTANHSSGKTNQNGGDLLSVEVGLGVFAVFIVLSVIAGLVFFATVFCYCRSRTQQRRT